MPDSLCFFADSAYAHRWPRDSPAWDGDVQRRLDGSINKNPERTRVAVGPDSVTVGPVEFHSLRKVAVSVPFFKDECRMIFEAEFGGLSAHVHLTIKSGDFLEIFNRLMAWKAGL